MVYRIVPALGGVPRLLRLFIQTPTAFIVSLLLIMAGRIRLVHTHSTSVGTIGVAVGAALSWTRIIYDCRDEDFPPPLVKIGRKTVWFSCASNIDEKLRRSTIPDDLIIRTPVTNPPYVSEYTSTSVSDEGLSVVYVGALRREKGVLLLCRAFNRLQTNYYKATLTIVGDGPAKSEVEALTEKQVSGVSLTGELDHRTTLTLISESDVLILPSASEGTPRVICEALDIGTPVIATPVGDVPRIVSHEENGLVVERSEVAIANALKRVAKDRELLKQFRKDCIDAAPFLSWETAVNQVTEGYDRALST